MEVRSGADSVDVRALIGLLQGHPDVVIGGHFSVEEMYRVMGEARFCLVPKGKSAWSGSLQSISFDCHASL